MFANSVCRRILRIVALVPIASMIGLSSAAAEEPPLWTQVPTHIDRTKQAYERLPAIKVERDARIWLVVPDRIKMIDSGAFEFNKRIYRLSEIHPIQPKRFCKAVEGGRWPCGRMAMIFLGNLVRGKRLLCNVDMNADVVALANCSIISRDVATEVVTQGYGKPTADIGPLADVARQAQALAKSGLWRNPACITDFDRC